MKKQVWILAAVVVIVAIVIGAVVFGFLAGEEEPAPKPPVTDPVPEPKPEQPDDGDKAPVQPVDPNPSGGDSVVVYVPDEQGESLTPVGADAKDDSDQALIDALIQAGSLPEGVKVQSSETADGILTLDLNTVYGDAVRASGTTGESMLIFSLVNTFVQARGVDSVLLTVDGAPLESGHEIYDYPLQATN